MQIVRDRQARKFSCPVASFAQNKSRVVASKPRPICPSACPVEARSGQRVVNSFRLSCLSCLFRLVSVTPVQKITMWSDVKKSISTERLFPVIFWNRHWHSFDHHNLRQLVPSIYESVREEIFPIASLFLFFVIFHESPLGVGPWLAANLSANQYRKIRPIALSNLVLAWTIQWQSTKLVTSHFGDINTIR